MSIDYLQVRSRLSEAILQRRTVEQAVREELRLAGQSARRVALAMLVATLDMRDAGNPLLQSRPRAVDTHRFLVLVNEALFAVETDGLNLVYGFLLRARVKRRDHELRFGPVCKADTARYVGLGVFFRSAGQSTVVMEWISSLGESQKCWTRPLPRFMPPSSRRR